MLPISSARTSSLRWIFFSRYSFAFLDGLVIGAGFDPEGGDSGSPPAAARTRHRAWGPAPVPADLLFSAISTVERPFHFQLRRDRYGDATVAAT